MQLDLTIISGPKATGKTTLTKGLVHQLMDMQEYTQSDFFNRIVIDDYLLALKFSHILIFDDIMFQNSETKYLNKGEEDNFFQMLFRYKNSMEGKMHIILMLPAFAVSAMPDSFKTNFDSIWYVQITKHFPGIELLTPNEPEELIVIKEYSDGISCSNCAKMKAERDEAINKLDKDLKYWKEYMAKHQAYKNEIRGDNT